MPGLPAKDHLWGLGAAASKVCPSVAFGLCRRWDDSRVSLLHWYEQGLSEWLLPADALPPVLQLSGQDARHSSIEALQSPALQQFLSDTGAGSIVSAIMPAAGSVRFWLGPRQSEPPAPEQIEQLAALAASYAPLMTDTASDRLEELRRLDLAAAVLPTLLDVLDVRGVFDRLSRAAQAALPHDLLVAALFSEDLQTYSVFAVSGAGSRFSPNLPLTYVPAVIRAYRFSIVDDLLAHPLEKNSPASKMGGRSALRAPIRYRDRVIGGLTFVSLQTGTYTTADASIAIRLAEQVSVGLSHQHLAEESRNAAALRERAANVELLDELLNALVDSDELADVFGRVSDIAGKVLRHDAALLAVWLPDGQHVRIYASHGFPSGQPEVIELPDDLRGNSTWEHNIYDDLSLRTEPRYVAMSALGFKSTLRVPIRREGHAAAALVFLSKQLAAFTPADIPIARRTADRLAVALARDRELAASKRADDAAERTARLEARVRALTDELNTKTGFRRVVGESKEWRHVLTQATQVSSTSTTVLLLGESGTGKEVVARFLHRGSPRSGGPFVAINCAALPEQLLEAELFGYERGAFTGAVQSKPGQLEQASGGTLFLDEVAEMSPSAQAKFLRVLQEREFQRLGGTRVLKTDARIVAATNRDLPRDIAAGKFREDLFYRLNVFAINLPPLRVRRDDILTLSEEFLYEIGRGFGRPPAGISRDAKQLLTGYHWPGNVRELRNVLERAAILSDGGLITAEHLALSPPPVTAGAHVSTPAAVPPPVSGPPASDLHSVERTMIDQALKDARFNKSKAAKALGLTRHQLYIRMRKHGFD